MAEKFQFEDVPNYQATRTYKEASPERRRQINRYKKENGISDDHMLLLLYRQDLDNVPEEQRTNSDMLSNVMLIVGFLLLWNSLQTAMGGGAGGVNVFLIFLSLASFLGVCAVYFLGLLNPYKRAVRKTDKALKEMPEVPDFVMWDIQNPDRADRKAKRSQARR
jgi:hypothetical protein